MRYCCCVASIHHASSAVGFVTSCATLGVRISVEVKRRGREGLFCLTRNLRKIMERTWGMGMLSVVASWKTAKPLYHRLYLRCQKYAPLCLLNSMASSSVLFQRGIAMVEVGETRMYAVSRLSRKNNPQISNESIIHGH